MHIDIKTYKGVDIFNADSNSTGIKYYARYNGETLRADTLQGIKNLIDNAILEHEYNSK